MERDAAKAASLGKNSPTTKGTAPNADGTHVHQREAPTQVKTPWDPIITN